MDIEQENTEVTLVKELNNSGMVVENNLRNADSIISEYEVSSAGTDELISIVDTMGLMSGHLTDANQGESISASTAQALGIAVEHLCMRAGIGKTPVFALEGFGGRMARKQSTRVALESITSVIKTIIDKILKWLKAAMKYLYDTMQELMSGADNIANAAKGIQVKAKAVAHKTIKPGKNTLTNDTFVKFFSRNGKVFESNEIHPIYKAYSDKMNHSFSSGFIKEMTFRVNEAVEEAKAGESKEATSDKVDKLIKNLKDRAFPFFDKDEKATTKFNDVLTVELPFGQRDIVVSLSKDEYGLYSGLNVSIEKIKDTGYSDTENKLDVLDYGQILEISKEVENQMLFGLFKNYKNAKSDLSKMERIIEKGCDEITHNQQNGKSNNETSTAFSVHFLKDLAASLVSMTGIVHHYDILMSKNLLHYCDSSIKMYS